MSAANTVEETCSCGATFRYTGHDAKYAADSWRKSHAVCSVVKAQATLDLTSEPFPRKKGSW